jgi:CO dehydrogenase maturation factor
VLFLLHGRDQTVHKREVPLKIAVSGKGGTGKTTFSALIALALAERGEHVIAIDADSNSNLAYALGIPEPESIIPLSEMNDLIKERTGAEKGKYGVYFKMNPRVDDIPEKYHTEARGVKLLTMGSVTAAGGGCVCPEYVLIKNLVAHMLLNRDETLILDMEAGLEHFGRGVTASVDVLIIIVNPDVVSTVTAGRVFKLASDLGIKHIFAVGNRVENDGDRAFIQERTPVEVIGFIPHMAQFNALMRAGESLYTDEAKADIRIIINGLKEIKNG